MQNISRKKQQIKWLFLFFKGLESINYHQGLNKDYLFLDFIIYIFFKLILLGFVTFSFFWHFFYCTFGYYNLIFVLGNEQALVGLESSFFLVILS